MDTPEAPASSGAEDFCKCCPRLAEDRRTEFLAAGGWLVIVLFGSVVTNIKADRVCFGYDDDAQCGGFGAYAIACSAISIFVALYALLTPK
eukprot:CAMPEP_0119535276 /NCGR_PEP_ID=MMETSP1344-20130328/48341_1 /TAXON_ID=236787 /ORGANISM="Florenciella parvula, Strain CCMP2471" /LENGTH=90 /DNA_ID=CAMNT_0007576827 /DNA_START=70 /DNA_END=339 /DNA_ORIENTATION=-